jgi:16S rRNA (cytosine967-C5)-methyltransferase
VLAENAGLRRLPIGAGDNVPLDWLTTEGDLRTLPCQRADPVAGIAGVDGFFAARLQRI